jgi:hypothetical protein
MFNAPAPNEDDALARAVREAGCVVLLEGLERQITGQAGSSIEVDQPTEPIPKLAAVAAAPETAVPPPTNR